MKQYILIISILFSSIYANSQSEIRGKITSKEDAELIPGANIYIPELQRGCVSDAEGFYKITNLPEGHFHVQFSMMGYSTIVKHVNIAKSPLEINVELQQRCIHSQEVVVSAGSYMTQHENAIKIETLNSKKLQSLNNVSFLQSLSSIPGVDLISKGNGVASPVIRGLSLSNLLVLNNGIRLENFQFSENHPFMTDDYGVEKIELIKGPASLLYGSDAIGGVINMIREKHAAKNTIVGDFNSVYHSNTDGYQGNLGVKINKNDIYCGIRLGRVSHRDYTDGGDVVVPNSRFTNSSAKFNAGISRNFGKFEFFYDYNKMNLGMSIPPALAVVKNNVHKNEYWFQDLDNHLLHLKNTIFVNQFKINVNVAYQMNNRKLKPSAVPPKKTNVDMQLNTLLYELKVYLPTVGNNDIIVGMQGTHQQNANADAPLHVLPDYTANDLSVYGLYQRDFGKSVHFQAGLRYDTKKISVPQQVRNPKAKTGKANKNEKIVSELNTDYANLSGSIGATFNISKQLLLRSNFASAYRTPNIAELTQNGMHGNRYEQGDRNLKSQRSYEGDLSVHYHSKFISFDVGTFYNRVNNFIFLSPTNETTKSGDKIYRYVQNEANLYGVETGFSVRPNSIINGNISYAYILGEDVDGNALPFIPQNKINTSIDFGIEKLAILSDIKLSLSSVYAFSQDNPARFESKTDSYILFDAAISCNIPIFGNNVELGVNAHNLFNNDYFDHLSTLKSMGFYNMGRNFSFSLKIPFNGKL